MRYQKYQTQEDKGKWLRLETTLGTNEETIRQDIQSFIRLVLNMTQEEKDEFEEITGVPPGDIVDFKITDQKTLQLVLLRKFIAGIGLSIINEALVSDGLTEERVFLKLCKRLLDKGEYPDDVFAYSIYRSRGTPNTWLSIPNKYVSTTIEKTVDTSVPKIINKVNYHLNLTRRYISKSRVDNLVLYLLSKPTSAKVVRGERKNVEVQGASYTILVLDLDEKRIGVVTGSKREVQIAHYYLIHKAFDEDLAPPRNDVEENGVKLLNQLLKPDQEDLMLLQSLELRKTSLHNNPSLKVRVQGQDTLDEALDTLEAYWTSSSIADVRQIEFGVPAGPVGIYKKLGLYTYGDEWKRTYFNTSSRRVTNLIEQQFLDKISKRLNNNDIKTTRFILQGIDSRFIIDKLLKDKIVSTNPAIPEDAENMVVRLTEKKLIANQEKSAKRKCWNCYAESWNQQECPKCGRSDMRIVSEAIRIQPNEAQIIRQISQHDQIKASYETKYFPSKQRRGHAKPVLSIYDETKNINVFVILVSSRKDMLYANDLSNEGFGVVAIADPKVDSLTQEIERNGATVISLVDIMLLLIGETSSINFATAVDNQEKEMLARIVTNAKYSLGRIKSKRAYDEAQFEVDIKNMMNLLVPDVVRLGTEYTGLSVPDGYLRYGTEGKRGSKRGRRLFGWDAKYSATSTYRLGERDVKKQKKYMDWLMDKNEKPSKFGRLGIYAIVANFDDPKRMDDAITNIAKYKKLPTTTRIVLIEERLLANICDWLLDNWQSVLDNNSLVADQAFKFLRRKSRKQIYTISTADDWEKLKTILEKTII